MKSFLLVALMTAPALAQQNMPTNADSALVARILLAEDQRDSVSSAFHEAASNADARIRDLARRAVARIRDPKFVERTSFSAVPQSRKYNDPAWRIRFRALATRRTDCDALREGLADSVWAVRLRAADLVSSSCSKDTALVSMLAQWAINLPRSAKRARSGVSWHASAHALAALATAAPAAATPLLGQHAMSTIPWVRAWAVRTAASLSDTATLKKLAHDRDDNVKEQSIDALSKLAGHALDDEYIAALSAKGYQAVRAAARALEKSPRGDAVLRASLIAARRLRRDSSETSRDARMALLSRIGEFATPANEREVSELTKDFDCEVSLTAVAIAIRLGAARAASATGCTPMRIVLPADAVALALGREIRVRVTLADSSGGGSFVVRLRGDVAPIMAGRVLALVRSGYYNGLIWQRVEPDFVVQGGGLGANEYVGHPRFMRDELGLFSHLRGTIGMSTRGHDTGDGQWFFNVKDNARLDADYTNFAEVVEGMEIVDGIVEGDVIKRMEVMR